MAATGGTPLVKVKGEGSLGSGMKRVDDVERGG